MIRSFEGARGIAALLVGLFHLKLAAAYVAPIRNGYIFVDLFFVLSGFLICFAYAGPLARASALKPFVIRRFGRLFPLFVFSTVLYVVCFNLVVFAKLQLVARAHGGDAHPPALISYHVPTFFEVLASLTLTQSLGFFDRPILNFVSWSISTEFYAYLLFALLCRFFHGARRLVAFALLCLAGFLLTAWASIVLHDCRHLGRCLDVTYDFGFARCVSSFLLGALTLQLRARLSWPARYAGPLQVLAVAVLFALFASMDRLPLLALAFPPAFSFLLLALGADTGWLASLLRRPACQILGQRSYSIYMMHPIVLLFMQPLMKNVHGFAVPAAVMAAYIGVLLVVSGWTYRSIEEPFRTIFNRMAAAASLPEKAVA